MSQVESQAEANTQVLEKFHQTAETVYQGAIEGDLIKVRSNVTQLESQLKQIPLGDLTSVEGIRALTNSIVETKRVVNAVKVDPQRWLFTTAKMRLAVDALIHAKQPMWVQYYKVFLEDIDQLERAAKAGQGADVQQSFRGFQEHYELIRPSAIIQRDPSTVEAVDSYVSYLQTRVAAQPFQSDQAVEVIAMAKPILQQLFQKTSDTPTFVPIGSGDDIWVWTIGIGAVVISVLTYVGWRKYQYEKQLALRKKFLKDQDPKA
jgi:sporulation protein YpjB